MSGMIPHHAQAVIMAGWAPTHGARPDVAVLCERIVVAQRDGIAMMRECGHLGIRRCPARTVLQRLRDRHGGLVHLLRSDDWRTCSGFGDP
jgi:hypothetical protein